MQGLFSFDPRSNKAATSIIGLDTRSSATTENAGDEDLNVRGRLSKVTVAERTLVLRARVEAFVSKSKLGVPQKGPGGNAAKRVKAKK